MDNRETTSRTDPGDDLSSLAWVQDELRRSLDAAHKALRRFLKESEAIGSSDVDVVDPAVLRGARTQIHQGAGALELVGLPAAATVLRASEAVLQRFVAKPHKLSAEVVDAIEHASFGLLDFISRKLAGKPVSPLWLFPQYRALQEAAGAERTHPADLWESNWRWRELPADPGVAARAVDAATHGLLEGQMLAMMRSPQPLVGAGRMSDICAGLGAGAGSLEPATLWKLASAVFEAQAQGLLGFDLFSKRLASRLLAQFRALERGETAVSERLAQDLLFFCAQSASPGDGRRAPRLASVRQAYGLIQHLPVDYASSPLGRFDPALVLQARKRVAAAKDSWSGVAGGEMHRQTGMAEQFALVADSLERLFPGGAGLAAELQAAVGQVQGGAPEATLAMEVATALLYVDAALEDADFDHPEQAERVARLAQRLAGVRAGRPAEPLETWMEELYRRVSDRQTMGSVVQELRASLSEVEKTVDQFFRKPEQRELLIPVPNQLASMRGVLSVLGMDQASAALLRMRDEVDALAQTEIDVQRAPSTGVFDRLAGNLGALGFLIDMLGVQPALAKSLFRFDAATGSLEPVMGRGPVHATLGEDKAAAPPPVAPRLIEQAQQLAYSAVRHDVPVQAVVEELGRLSDQARAADQQALVQTVEQARGALAKADEAHDEIGLLTLRGDLSEALVDFVSTASEPVGLVPAPVPAAPPAAPAPAELGEDDEMRGVFLDEAREVLQDAAAAHASLVAAPSDLTLQTTLRRAFHTLKGSSRMVGLKDFGDAAWSGEQVYNAQLAEHQAAPEPLLAFTGLALQHLGGWVEDIAAGRAAGRSPTVLQDAAARLAAGEEPALPPAQAPAAAEGVAALPTVVEASSDAEPAADTLPGAAAEAGAGFDAGAWDEPFALAAEPAGHATPSQPELQPDPDSADAHAPAAAMSLLDLPFELPSAADLDLPMRAEEPPAQHALPEPEVDFDLSMSVFDELPFDIPAPASQLAPPASLDDVVISEHSIAIPLDDAPDSEPAGLDISLDLDAFDTDPHARTVPIVEALQPSGHATAAGIDLDLAVPEVRSAEPQAEHVELPIALASEPMLPVAEAPAPDSAPEPPQESDDSDLVKVVGPLRISIPLFNIYLNEADELSRRLTTEVAEWALELHRPVGETPIALAHSLAGSSATVGFQDLSQLARALEHALMRVQAIGAGTSVDARLFVDAAEEVRRLLHQFAAGFLKQPLPELLERLAEHELSSARRLNLASAMADRDPASQLGEIGEPPVIETLMLDVMPGDAQAEPAVEQQPEALPEPQPEPQPERQAAAEPPVAREPAPRAVGASPDAPSAGPAPAEQAALPQPAAAVAQPPAVEALESLFQPLIAELKPLAATEQTVHRFSGDAPLTFEGSEDIDAVDAVDAELFPIFEEEGLELLPQLSARLRDWVRRPTDPAPAAACMRTLHTLKGGARLAGAMRLGEMAHRLETRIEGILAHPPVGLADVEQLQARGDALAQVFEALRERDARAYEQAGAALQAEPAGAAPRPEPPALMPAPLQSVVEPAAPTPVVHVPVAASAAPALIDWAPFMHDGAPLRSAERAAPVSQSAVRVRAPLLDRLVNQAGEISITRSRIESGVGQMRGSLADLTENLERLRGQLRDIELQAETQMSSRLEAAKAASQSFDPLEFDRFTRFQELTRMMAESVNDVATVQRSLQRAIEGAEDELAAQARLNRELQDDLLRTRMVEFESLSDRLYRVVRQAAKETGKQVRLDIVGGSIEIDRGVLDRMTGAFEHLLRNSVSHGIETPAQRAAAGKDPTGTVVVALAHEGNEVGVEFRDDGGGLDLARIRVKAESLGLLQPGQERSDAELAELIFAPGFSTADAVTELAGRGVGMDVVRSDVTALGGRIETASSPGKGAAFKLVLPLTTAVTQVVMLRCGAATVAVPSTLVEIVRRATPREVDESHARGSYLLGERALPFFWLGALLQISPCAAESSARTRPVLVIRSAQQRVAIQVDEVLGNQEVVVKNLGPQLSRLPGLAGMTLLASGAVALIYNPVALAALYGDIARAATQAALAAPATALAQPAQPEAPAHVAPLILVVDDSLTVRRVTQRLLVREGYRVVLAKDGMDALERLAEEVPQVVLSDIEMPRMDGFDLVRNIRGDARLRELPVIMITSRIAQKHREYAAELGVDHYLGKPYSEEDLLALIGRYAAAEALA